MRFVNYKDRKAIATAFKPIYTAVDADAAKAESEAFKKSPLGQKYPHAVAAWEAAWERFIPFLEFPPELRRVITPHRRAAGGTPTA
jgi:putative transposase